MPNRFSSQYDYSQVFQSLATQQQQSLEAAAQRVDAEHEAERAAEDALMFTKWKEGKVSGQQLMAHISSRIGYYSYDRAERLKWQEAAIEYGNIISDERAEGQYAQDQNIHALIRHYNQRLGATKQGTPEYRELATRIRSLTEKRDSDNIAKQSRIIARQIQNGKAGTRDLIDFYRSQLPKLSGDLRQTVLDNIAELRTKLRQENFEAAMLKIDNALESGHISPQDAATQKVAVLGQFNIQSTDKVAYQEWMGQVRQLRAMPDPVEISQLELALQMEQITPEQYYAQINEWADRIAPFDLNASWELRIEAERFLEEEATPLEDPGALGLERNGMVAPGGGSRGYSGTIEVVRRLRGNAIKHITQLDSSAYSQYNCTMASGAMLAHAMGYTGLSGADLRNLSGVSETATNIQQLQGALQQVGVDGTRLKWDDRIEFDRFKQAVGSGAPAVLSGWLGDIPAQLNSSGIIGGHAMFVAGYDAKRDAFLMLDPAKSSDSGTWWPASIVEDFGWGGERHGQALLAPRGTIDPATLQRAGSKVKHINVTARPTLGGPPITSRIEPPDGSKALQEVNARRLREQRERLADAGVTQKQLEGLTSQQRVEALLDERAAQIEELNGVLEEYATLAEEDPDGTIEMLTGELMSPQDVASLERRLIYLYDGQEALYTSIGASEKAQEQRNAKRSVLLTAKLLNSERTDYLVNRELSNLTSVFRELSEAKDPNVRRQRMQELHESLDTLSELNDPTEAAPAEEGEVTTVADEQASRVDDVGTATALANTWERIAEVLNGEHADSQSVLQEMAALADEEGFDEEMANVTDLLTSEVASQVDLDNGLATMLLVPDEQGQHRLQVVPLKETQSIDPTTGEPVATMVPDLSALGEGAIASLAELGYNARNLPVAQMADVTSDSGVTRVQFIPYPQAYEGVDLLAWGEGITTASGAETLKKFGIDIKDIETGQILDDATVSQILATPRLVEALQTEGILTPAPFVVQTLNFDGRTHYQDRVMTPEGLQSVWYQDNLPWVGRAPSDETLNVFGSSYFGGEIVDSVAWVTLQNIDFDPTDTGEMIVNLGVSNEQAATDAKENGGFPDTVYARDPLDPTKVVVVSPNDIRHPTSAGAMPLADFVKRETTRFLETMDRIATQMAPEQVAELEYMDMMEKRELALAMGIDPDNPTEWRVSPLGGGVPQKPPDQKVLSDLGITATGSEEPEPGPAPIDHLEAARESARGLVAANKASKEAKRAADEAKREAALAASKASRLTPKPSLVKLPTPYKVPTPTPVAPAPSPAPTKTYDPLSSISAPTPTKPVYNGPAPKKD